MNAACCVLVFPVPVCAHHVVNINLADLALHGRLGLALLNSLLAASCNKHTTTQQRSEGAAANGRNQGPADQQTAGEESATRGRRRRECFRYAAFHRAPRASASVVTKRLGSCDFMACFCSFSVSCSDLAACSLQSLHSARQLYALSSCLCEAWSQGREKRGERTWPHERAASDRRASARLSFARASARLPCAARSLACCCTCCSSK